MSNNIRIDEDIMHLLKLKSDETGISQDDLANKYILEGLKKDKRSKSNMTIDDVKKLLEYDLDDGDNGLSEIANLIDSDDENDAGLRKKESNGR